MLNIATADLTEQMIQVARLLFQSGVMPHSGYGDISVRIPGTAQILLTTGGTLTYLTAEQVALGTLNGDIVSGVSVPVTHEITALHTAIYRERPDIGVIIHTHSPYVTSFALAHESLPSAYEALLRFGITSDIPVVAWTPYNLNEAIANTIAQIKVRPSLPAVLLANHGLLAFGHDLFMAAYMVIAIEEAAEMTLRARMLGGERPFPVASYRRETIELQLTEQMEPLKPSGQLEEVDLGDPERTVSTDPFKPIRPADSEQTVRMDQLEQTGPEKAEQVEKANPPEPNSPEKAEQIKHHPAKG